MILLPLGLVPIFILYSLYRLLIARDAKKHQFELVLGSVFTLMWGVIYFLIFI
jgi:hypothetical protein